MYLLEVRETHGNARVGLMTTDVRAHMVYSCFVFSVYVCMQAYTHVWFFVVVFICLSACLDQCLTV